MGAVSLVTDTPRAGNRSHQSVQTWVDAYELLYCIVHSVVSGSN